MTKTEAIKALRRILARLYGDEVDRVIRDAELDAAFIKKSAAPLTYWFNILDEAEKRTKLDAVLKIADDEYGAENPDLRKAYNAYLVATGQGPVAPTGAMPTLTLSRPVKILFLAANPTGTERLKLDEEVHAIKEALRTATFYERFALEQEWAVRYLALQRLLLEHKPNIVHFSGHGSTAGELQFQNESGDIHIVSPQALTGLFGLVKKNIRCVVLNACYTVIQGGAIAEEIDAVVGMNRALGDKAAIQFAAGFYGALGYGESVKSAFELGRNLIDLAGLGEQDKPQLLTPNSDPTQLVFVSGE